MSVWAHPDDESFLAAGILVSALHNGQTVICVTATKGEAGIQDENKWPAEQLGDIRKEELEKALKILGITNHNLLGYVDDCCSQANLDEAAGKIRALIDRYQPDSILTFGPDGWTGNPDHRAVSHWVERAIQNMENPPVVYHVVGTSDHYTKHLKEADEKINIFYNIEKPPILANEKCDIVYRLPREVCKLKCSALKVMESQTSKLFELYERDRLYEMWAEESFVRAKVDGL